MTFLFY